jgi:hypothetical protein
VVPTLHIAMSLREERVEEDRIFHWQFDLAVKDDLNRHF